MNHDNSGVASSVQADGRASRAGTLVNRIGVAYAIILGVYFAASPFLAAVAPFYRAGWHPSIEGVGLLLAPVSTEPLHSWLRGDSPFRAPAAFALAYSVLAGSATICWGAALITLHRYRDAVSPQIVRSVLRWGIAFAAILIFATPVIVHDFWLSVGWGRLIAAGENPYYVPMSSADLPFRIEFERMTYGPLWAVMTGATAVMAAGNLLVTAAIQKLVLTAAWLGCIAMVRSLTTEKTPGAQALAIAVVGWAPIGLLHGVADGHTDALLAFPLLLWLKGVEESRPFRASLALMVSIAVKYITAPLLILHVLGRPAGKENRGVWVRSAILCVVIVIALVAVFYRSPEFFTPVTHMRTWRFFTPAAIGNRVIERVGFGHEWLPQGIDLALGAVILIIVIARIRERTVSGFRSAVLWTMLGVLLCTLGHVWPWFLMWVLPLAAIQLDRRGAWAVIGMTAISPFILLPMTVLPGARAMIRVTAPGVALYLAALAALLIGQRVRRNYSLGRA